MPGGRGRPLGELPGDGSEQGGSRGSPAGLFVEADPTVVVGTQSRGTLLGALVAVHLGLGLIELRKSQGPPVDSESWRSRTTPPDYRDQHLTLGFPQRLLPAGERVLWRAT